MIKRKLIRILVWVLAIVVVFILLLVALWLLFSFIYPCNIVSVFRDESCPTLFSRLPRSDVQLLVRTGEVGNLALANR